MTKITKSEAALYYRIRLPRDFIVKEHKMTRNDALNKLAKVDEIHDLKFGSIRPNEVIIDKLEALGVLKFDPEPIATMFGIPVKSIIKCLEDNGYCVYKKGGE